MSYALLLGHIVEEAAECGQHDHSDIPRTYSQRNNVGGTAAHVIVQDQEEAIIDNQRAVRYERLYEQLRGLIEDKSPGLQAAMATVCAVLHAKMQHHFWTGFYFVKSQDELHVGPYQGPVACQILKGQGVCLHGARTKEPVVVPDVEAFPGHIACDSRSKSGIVIPLVKDGAVVAVLDVDSSELNQFSNTDIEPLTKILQLLNPYL